MSPKSGSLRRQFSYSPARATKAPAPARSHTLRGVNEATLFRCFARKADLFWAAAESRLSRLKLGRELQQGLASDLDPEIVVPMLVEFVVNIVAQYPELMGLVYVAGFELPGGGAHVSRASGINLRRGERVFQALLRPRRDLQSGANICDSWTGRGGQCAPQLPSAW